MIADEGAVQERMLERGGGPVIGQDSAWLRRNWQRVASFAGQLVLFNGLALLLLRRAADGGSPQWPGSALLVVGGLLMVSALEVVLEAERPALTTPPARSLTWVLARKALLATAIGTAGALPIAWAAASSLPSPRSALLPLAYGAACICLLAFFQVAFWVRSVSPSQPASLPQRLFRLAQLALIGAILRAGLGSLSEPASLVSFGVLAVAFACAFWHPVPELVASLSAPDAARARAPTAVYALATLLVLAFVRAFVVSVCLHGGASPANATALGFIIGGVVVLGLSLLVLWMRDLPALGQQLGLGAGKGLRVILREALLWSAPAVLFNQGYWAILGQRVAGVVQSASQAPATMTVLKGSPLALVSVGVIAAPVLEELLFRGMLHRALRTRWSLVPSLLLSSLVFLTDHAAAGAIPVFVGSVCMTLAFERSRSLYSAMLTHSLCNGVLVVQMLMR
jgi:membrane protease YdiL (CAAX protease family)